MQIKDYLARILMWSAFVTVTTTLPAMGQTNYPLRLRGSSGITTAYTDGNLVIEFQPGTSPAGNDLQPGQGSWLDRGLRPTEPNVLKQTVSLDQAKAIADYLRTETHFATFYCYNTNQGYFQAGNSAPFIPEWVSSNNPAGSGFKPDGNSNSSDGGSSGNAGGVLSGNTIADGTAVKRRDGKDHRDDHKDHRDNGKEDHEVANKGHDEGKEHYDKDHHTGTGSHGVALVKANPKPAPRVTTKAAPHHASKKKA
jgi:hypothetical protein